MNFHQFISILWSRKSIVLLALMMTVITALMASLLLPKQYIATTSIMVEQRSVNPVTGQTLPAQLLPSYIATQVDVITSHNVARRVVDKLKLSENEQMQKDFASAQGLGDISDWIADSLLKKLEVKPSRESSLIQVDFTFITPLLAAQIANAFADAYIQTGIELHSQPAKLSAEWFESQMATLRERLERAQSVLSTYQQQHGIIATDNHLDLESVRLSELSRQLVESQALTNDLQSRKDLLTSTVKKGDSTESLQEILSNPLIQSLKTELARAEADFAELSKRVDINHPQYKQAKAEVSSLQQKIQSETRMLLNSITSGVVSSIQRDKIRADAVAEQKAKVLELKKQQDEIAVFQREAENAQRAYDAVMQRAVQSRMESEMNQTSISVLNPALVPQKHAKPNLRLNMILSVFLGSLLGVGAALLAELMDRRVRSAFDVSDLLAIPVFAVISASASQPKRIARQTHPENTLSDFNNRGGV
jgi:chain length determinant protein EpsF